MCQEKDVPFFGAPGYEDGSLRVPIVNHGRGMMPPTRMHPISKVLLEGPVIQGETVQCVDANTRILETDAMYIDVNYEDEVDMTYREV